jgi:hypothetical protein
VASTKQGRRGSLEEGARRGHGLGAISGQRGSCVGRACHGREMGVERAGLLAGDPGRGKLAVPETLGWRPERELGLHLVPK